ncbi:hypothetical protein AVEN_215006-1 [Araneus ventricosus]|uniref:Uncharacterized protein n=1 Tax=Araneus ventricosus TaxID=182803 RepID=A0A4Y2PY96_ARAVE|nr:hypothetical protein AVEN_222487-1 [Araneus ventricosus]GBN56916.1 hypothetical protein AVEN_274523-1 [Araneus ventricosus]GBN57225.1 hypothetical protein AVEN_215006-1 [Araneus ventricosus]
MALGGMGDVRLKFFLLAGSPKAGRPFHYTQLKHKGNGQSQTSSLGRPRSSANKNCTLLLYHESFAYSIFSCVPQVQHTPIYSRPSALMYGAGEEEPF